MCVSANIQFYDDTAVLPSGKVVEWKIYTRATSDLTMQVRFGVVGWCWCGWLVLVLLVGVVCVIFVAVIFVAVSTPFTSSTIFRPGVSASVWDHGDARGSKCVLGKQRQRPNRHVRCSG